jgi:hypothetical protein
VPHARNLPLRILGADGEPLPHHFLQSTPGTDVLGVLLPGFGYRATMPLLYYAERALLWRGADVLRCDLAYDLEPAFVAADADARRAWLRTDAERATQAALEQGDYRRVALVGKSLGTLAMAALLDGPIEERTPTCVWLTPLLGDEGLRETVLRTRPRSLFVIGDADPLYDPAALRTLAGATGDRTVVVEGADHSLEVPGDLTASLRCLATAMDALEDLLGNRSGDQSP